MIAAMRFSRSKSGSIAVATPLCVLMARAIPLCVLMAWATPASARDEQVLSRQAAEQDSGTGEHRTRAEATGSGSAASVQTAPSDRTAWTVEPFLRGGFTGMLADSDVVFDSRLDDAVSEPSRYHGISTQLRSSHWGAGLRAMRGRWGLEATWQQLGAADLFGAAVLKSEIAATRLGGVSASLRDVTAQVLGVLTLVEFGLPGADSDGFVGFGVGHVRVAGPSEALGPQVHPPTFFWEDGESFPLRGEPSPAEVGGDRASFLVGGSAGVTLARGRLLLRPRLDVFVAHTMSEDESWAIDLRYADEQRRFRLTGVETLETLVRSSVFLFSLDLGWSFGQ